MISTLRSHRRWSVLATGAAIVASTSLPASAQSDDSDLLAPLVPPNDDSDLLAPLVPSDDDLLAPLVPSDDDLLAPLVPPKPRKPSKPGTVTHKDELEMGPVENGYMLVKRKIVDPCGIFEISWGGRKTCHPYERETWEYVAVGGDAGGNAGKGPEPDDDDDDGEDDKSGGRAPGGRPPSGSGGKGPGGKSPGPKEPQANGPGAGPASGSGGGGTGPRGGAAPGPVSGNGGIVAGAPAADGFARLEAFAVRLDTIVVDAKGRFDIGLTVRNVGRATKLVANGDWTVTLTDADGLGFSSRDIWMAGTGAEKPFNLMPNVAPGGTQQVRFILEPEAVRANVVSLSVQQGGAAPATFDISARKVGHVVAAAAPDPSSAPFTSLHRFDVRLDQAGASGGKFELFFTARNRTNQVQYLGGSNLTFTGIGPAGETMSSRRETYSIRGARVAPVRMAPVQPGATARLRAVFDAPRLKEPFTVTDGIKTGKLAAPALPRAVEPEW